MGFKEDLQKFISEYTEEEKKEDKKEEKEEKKEEKKETKEDLQKIPVPNDKPVTNNEDLNPIQKKSVLKMISDFL